MSNIKLTGVGVTTIETALLTDQQVRAVALAIDDEMRKRRLQRLPLHAFKPGTRVRQLLRDRSTGIVILRPAGKEAIGPEGDPLVYYMTETLHLVLASYPHNLELL